MGLARRLGVWPCLRAGRSGQGGGGGEEAAIRRCRDGKVTPHWRPAFPFPFPFSVARPRELLLSCRHYAPPRRARGPLRRASAAASMLARMFYSIFPFLWN